MFIILAIVIILIIYFYTTQNYNYWRQKNVKYIKPAPFFGSEIYKIITMPTQTEMIDIIYQTYPNEKLIGFFSGRSPVLLIKDPVLLKHVGILDFDHFHQQTLELEFGDRDTVNLFLSSGDQWKFLRQATSPAFTLNKMKKMFPLVLNCAQRLQMLGDKIVSKGGLTCAFEVMSRFTMEFICSCGMGVDLDLIMDEQSAIYKIANSTSKRTKLENILLVVGEVLPLPKWVGLTKSYFLHSEMISFLNELVLKICENRNSKPSERNDFIDLLLELAMDNKRRESMEKSNSDGSSQDIDIDFSDPKVIAVQVYGFFLAGFETSASSTSFTLHQLAYHPEIQRKIQEQMDDILLKYNSKLSYDAVAEMTLLEMAYQESLRMFPPTGILRRVCTKKYTFPGTDVTIDRGVTVAIPISSIHTDEKYYPDPYEFKPERFSAECIKERNKDIYLPFGLGKRTCIARRLGLIQSITGLAAILQRFTVEPAPQSRREIKVNRACRLVQGVEGGIPIKLIPRISNKQRSC